jgi:hypothetical protein
LTCCGAGTSSAITAVSKPKMKYRKVIKHQHINEFVLKLFIGIFCELSKCRAISTNQKMYVH